MFVCFWFWLYHTACRILVPQPGIEPLPLAVEAQSLNHWTAREVLEATSLTDIASFDFRGFLPLELNVVPLKLV